MSTETLVRPEIGTPEWIHLDIAETPFRCEACGRVSDLVRWYEVPGAICFRFCGQCRITHAAIPIEQAPGGR